MTAAQLAACIEHTLLRPEATDRDLRRLCDEGREWGFYGVCVHPAWVAMAAGLLAGSPLRVVSVVGFPHGASTPTVKSMEARQAVGDGAAEVDMVLPIGALKSGDVRLVQEDIAAVVEAVAGQALVKVILETSFLADAEKELACRLAAAAGAHFVKTSTGFGPGGATPEDVRLLKKSAQGLGVKAAGGIRTLETARVMLAAGADRLGTSQSVAIMRETMAPQDAAQA